jgi:hypothetical protein
MVFFSTNLLLPSIFSWRRRFYYCDSRSGVVVPGTTSCCFHAETTVLDSYSSSVHLNFVTEGAAG